MQSIELAESETREAGYYLNQTVLNHGDTGQLLLYDTEILMRFAGQARKHLGASRYNSKGVQACQGPELNRRLGYQCFRLKSHSIIKTEWTRAEICKE